ncbi:MAG: hypothetical protein ABS59_23385 [Methylobacterium sp. SCN 67-24]|nr:MAG: hypothetical protein ABS59_23385 [Methylobacterium sp. SCN 67-24]
MNTPDRLIPVQQSGFPRSTTYKLLAEGKLKAVKVGSRTYIRQSDLDAFMASLPLASIGQGRSHVAA